MGNPRNPSIYKPDQNINGVTPQDILDLTIENRHIGSNEITLNKLADEVLNTIKFSITLVNISVYNLLFTDDILHVIYTLTGEVTINIPLNQSIGSDRQIIIKDADGNAGINKIRIITEDNAKIDGQDFYDLDINFESITIYLKDNNWFVI